MNSLILRQIIKEMINVSGINQILNSVGASSYVSKGTITEDTSDFIPSGICSTVSVRHEGECPVQKYGLKKGGK